LRKKGHPRERTEVTLVGPYEGAYLFTVKTDDVEHRLIALNGTDAKGAFSVVINLSTSRMIVVTCLHVVLIRMGGSHHGVHQRITFGPTPHQTSARLGYFFPPLFAFFGFFEPSEGEKTNFSQKKNRSVRKHKPHIACHEI
jgi:hypothetical protein